MRLFIRNREIELGTNTKIAQTIQANDLGDIRTRQTNFTNRFKVPITARNKQAMGYLGVVGNTSLRPYELNEVYLLSESGEVLINKGFATIKSTTDSYNINVYYGNLDLFKSMGNDNLSTLDLSELTHEKTVQNVYNTFIPNALNYRYIVADYNGNTEFSLFAENSLNIDHMIPSVKVEFLWDKIFEFHDFTYEGSIFLQEDFNNLWMTYPKGLLSLTPDEVVYDSDDFNFISNDVAYPSDSIYLDQVTSDTDELQNIFSNRHFQVFEDGNYKIEISGRFTMEGVNSQGDLIPINCRIIVGKNSEVFTDPTNVTEVLEIQENLLPNVSITASGNIAMQADESLCIVFRIREDQSIDNLININIINDVTLTITKLGEPEQVNFNDALVSFKQLDFVREVMVRYGLTPYKDKYSNHYKFLTLQELLQTDNIVDWSANNNKFSQVVSESYVYSNYAQSNFLRHKYNDSDDSYFDGSINVNNPNLREVKTVHSSKIYAPSKNTIGVLGKSTRTYKMWEKEVNDEGVIEYKPLSNRFYFMKSEIKHFDSSNVLRSETTGLNPAISINFAPYASFAFLSYSHIASEYYSILRSILDKARVIKAKIFLNEQDFSDINLIGVYYIRELGKYYILNKIKNFIKKGKTDVELIEVEYSNITDTNSEPIIDGVRVIPLNPTQNTVAVHYDSSRFVEANIDYSLDGGGFISFPNNGILNFVITRSNPAINHTLFLNSPTETSETVNFLS